MTIEQKRRELFESSVKGMSNPLFDEDLKWIESRSTYYWPAARLMWEGFNAALDAVVIELIPECLLDASDDPWYVREQCKDAIESTGLGLEVKA